MNTLYTCLFTLLFFLSAPAALQAKNEAPYSFLKTGKISMDDMKMTRYEKDTSASAVILYDGGRSRFEVGTRGNLVVNYDRHVIIKILKKSGYDWANVVVPIYRRSSNNREYFQQLKGYTYNLQNGEVVTDKLTKESIFEEKSNFNMYAQKFTLPNVKEGSVIEFTYRIESGYFDDLRNWRFQYPIPVAWSEYTTQVPQYFTYKKLVQGFEPFFINETKAATINITKIGLTPVGTENYWVMKDVPALRAEPYMDGIANFVARIEFELERLTIPGMVYESFNNTWPKVATTLIESNWLGDHLGQTGFTRPTVATVLNGLTGPEKKMQAIYTYVKNNLNYNGYENWATDIPLRKTLETKTGSAADINILLIAMLREAGLKANPVIMSTKENGYLSSHTTPNISRFNYVIAAVMLDDKTYLLDATEKFAQPNMLPVRCLNGEGLVIDNKEHFWVSLNPQARSNYSCFSQMAINPDNSVKGNIQVSGNGYAGMAIRNDLAEQGEKKYIEAFAGNSSDWTIDKSTILPGEGPESPLKINLLMSLPGQDKPAGTIYLNPLQNMGQKENPFKRESRKFPVDFATPIDETLIFNYTIPAGYAVVEQPKNAIVTLPNEDGKFMYSITTTGNMINFVSKVSINKPIFYAEEYPYLKEFYNQIVAKHAEQIVLKKVN